MLKIKIKKIFNTNQKAIKLSNYDFINYLDTSSITENYITNIQKLNVKKDNIPSRAKRLVKENTIVYSSVRPNLKHYGIIRKPISNMVASTGFITLDIKDSKIYDVDYLYYNLTQEKYTKYLSIIANNSVSSYPSINPADIENLEIEIEEDINIQKKISKVLSVIDSKIELNNKINSELEKIAKELYDYWFIQFEFPDKNNRPYKSNNGRMIYSPILKREIPIDWKVSKLKEECSIVLGGTPKTDNKEYWNGNINWLNSGEISQFPVTKSEATITDLGMNNSATTFMPKGTVVISITGNLRVSFLAIEACANQSVVGILESHNIKKSYLYPSIKYMLDSYNYISTGNCQQHINKGIIEDTYIILPSRKILNEYYKSSEQIFNLIVKNELETQNLISIRDFLLPMLMNGQVKVID